MSFSIWRPRLLLAICGVLAVAGSAVAVLAKPDRDARTRVEPVGAPPAATVSVADHERAVDRLRRDRSVEQILEGRGFEAFDPRPHLVIDEPGAPQRPAGVAFEIVLDRPLDSDGPWLGTRCRGSLTYELTARWTNVTVISVAMDPNSGTLLSFQPGQLAPGPGRTAWRGGDAAIDPAAASERGTISVRETASGRMVASARRGELTSLAKPTCPPGLSDD